MEIIYKILTGIGIYLGGFVAVYTIGWALAAGIIAGYRNSQNINHRRKTQDNDKENN
jgi:hypothetical protein